MASLRDIFVRLGFKTDPADFKTADNRIQRVKESAATLGRVLATGAVAYGFKAMIGTASSMEETANKFGAVFGTASQGVQDRLDDIRKRTGATNLQLQDMASNIGALIKPSLGSGKAAGDMATSISELALDISSFNDVTSEEALIALRSGLIGSAEPLQRFGVDTRIAALQQEALQQGITKSYQKMSEGERIALRYAAIQRQLGVQGATGDATRTAEGFANASRHLLAALKETAGLIGTFLLKSIGNAVNSMRDIVDTVQAWLKENRKLIQQGVDETLKRIGRIASAIATVIGDIADAYSDWSDSLGPVGQQILKITAIVLALVAAMMLPGVPILMLIGLIALLVEDFQTWRDGGESVIGDIIGLFEQLKNTVVGYAQQLKDSIGAMWEWAEEHHTGLTAVLSLLGGVIAAVGITLVAANKAAIASALSFKLFSVKYYAVVGAQAVASAAKSSAAWVASAAKSAAAWFMSTAPLVLTAALLAIIIGTLIFLGAELVKLAMGKDNFFSTMADGISGLIEDLGGIGPAIKSMLVEAARFWMEFFGATDEQISTWIESATETLKNFWGNIIDHWSSVLGRWWDKWSDFVDLGFGEDEEEKKAKAKEMFSSLSKARPDAEKGGGPARPPSATAQRGEGPARPPSATAQRGEGPAPEQAAMPSILGGPTFSRVTTTNQAAGNRSMVDNSRKVVNLSLTTGSEVDGRKIAGTVVDAVSEALDTEKRQAFDAFAIEGA